jgi:uncharacterized protein YgbK (DUF1537 family)
VTGPAGAPRRQRIVVLDDDPTGSQTVHGCLLLTRWDVKTLRTALADESRLFFILTNTRAMPADDAEATTREVCRNLSLVLGEIAAAGANSNATASEGASAPIIVSRSDSTLRGHYPVETDVIAEELGPFNAHFLVPAFFEAGRFTRDGTHYLRRGRAVVPVHETEFARDSVFGYTTSYLPAYVEEKTAGRLPAGSVHLVRPRDGAAAVRGRLEGLSDDACCVVDAETQADLDLFADLVRELAGAGRRFLFRSAASLITSLAALPPQPVPPAEMARYVPRQLERAEPRGRMGVVVVGSHVPLSTAQLEDLLARRSRSIARVELDVARLTEDSNAVIREARQEIDEARTRGLDLVIYTSRVERRFADATERLAFGKVVSDVLMRLVATLPEDICFIVSKGGITSHHVLATGLGLEYARVVGQILPGCSVVLTPETHRHGAIPVVIFPGNVGEADSLTEVYDRLTAAGPEVLS